MKRDSHNSDPSAALVESIVQAVLARLHAEQPDATAPATAVQPLLTLADVSSIRGGGELHIGSRTVITPAARDELAARGVRLIRSGSPPARAHSSADSPPAARGMQADEQRAAEIADDLRHTPGVRVITASRPYRLCCLLNRFDHVCAATIEVGHESALEENGFSPNVLVAPVITPQPLLRRWRYALLTQPEQGKESGP